MILSHVTPRHLGIRPDTDSSEFHSEVASRMADLVEHGGAYNLGANWIHHADANHRVGALVRVSVIRFRTWRRASVANCGTRTTTRE